MTTATKHIDAEVTRRMHEIEQRQRDALVAHLRAEAEAEFAADQARRERQARIEQLRSDIAEQLDPAPIDAAEAELAGALDRYVAVCVAHDRRYSALYLDLTNLAGSGPLPADMDATHRHISSGGVDWKKSRLHTRLIRAARAALDRNQPPDYVDLSRNPQD